MIHIVTCEQGKKIQLPDGVNASIGGMLSCPSECPKRSHCSSYMSSFRISASALDDGYTSPYGGLIRYNSAEVNMLWGDGVFQTFPDFGSAESADSDDLKSLEELKPVGKHNQIMVNMVVFTDDQSIRWKIPLSRPLDVAMDEIFHFWYTNAVFKNDHELHDSFVWLMTRKANGVIYKAEVDAILNNPEYNRSQKFFHLFYDVIYKNKHPGGFYWCDHNSSFDPLRPKFGSKQEFIKFLMSGDGYGIDFYKKRREEVLSYLEVDDEREFISEIICEHAKSCDEIIWIDTAANYELKRFGSKRSFLQNMCRPTSLSSMRQMIDFLGEYRVTESGISRRPGDIPFEMIGGESSVNESTVYDLIGLSRQDMTKTGYETYLSLLAEYLRSNSPATLKVGPLSLSGNYYEECEKYIFDFCCNALINNGEVDAQDKKKAILAASLIERGVFGGYGKKISDSTRELIKLASSLNPESGNCNMSWYIGTLKTDNTAEFIKRINGNRLVQEWFKRSSGDSAAEVNKIITKYNDLYRRFEQKS